MFYFKLNKIIVFSFLLIIFFVPYKVFSFNVEQDLFINKKPSFPKAYQQVTLSLESYLTNLDKDDISWYKNGVLERRGVGEKNFSFETGKLGEVDVILVKIGLGHSEYVSKEIKIRPAEVDLIYDADSYTPPFYKGKALNSYQSDVKIVAIPNLINKEGYKIKSENLIYKWRKDWTVLGKSSGVGKDTLFLNSFTRFRDSFIVVDVESLDGSVKAQQALKVKSFEPEIVFYEKDPLFGVLFNKSVENSFNLKNDEIILKASPFFFSKEDFLNNNLKYKWSLNNKKISTNDDIIVLRKEEDSKGKSYISLNINNIKKIMQEAYQKISINFENN